MKRKIFQAALIVLSLLATIKICFFGLGIDEEYAVTMAYRMAAGDRMFLDMWEPHQTSGFLAAGLIRLFLALTGGTDFLVLYLRVAGAVIQALIALFLYRTLKRSFSPDASFVAAVFFYNTLPKWIQTPEFSNMLVWFSVLAMLCFLRYYLDRRKKKIWLAAACLSFCGLVLSYPSCILAAPVIALCMWMADRRSFRTDICIAAGTCAAAGILYVAYFLSHMSVSQFVFGLKQMMTDGAHSAGLPERLQTYGAELLTLLPHAGIALGLAGLVILLIKRLRSLPVFCLLAICTAQLAQGIVWMGSSRYLHFPLVYFYILYGAGLVLYLRKKPETIRPSLRILFWMGSMAGGAVWLSGLLITNTTISVTGSYLMMGLVSAIMITAESIFGPPRMLSRPDDLTEPAELTKLPGSASSFPPGSPPGFLLSALPFLAALCLLGTTLFGKGFMMNENEGVKNNITYVRQKALYGPAKGIYYRYMEGYGYNSFALLAPQYIKDGDTVLYIGQNTLFYVLCGQTISTYSTISTPTFDERLAEYWELHPQRYPSIVIVDKGYTGEAKLDHLLKLGEPVAEAEGIVIYSME